MAYGSGISVPKRKTIGKKALKKYDFNPRDTRVVVEDNAYRNMPQCTDSKLVYNEDTISVQAVGEIAAIQIEFIGNARFRHRCGKGWLRFGRNNTIVYFSIGKAPLNLSM